MNSKVNKTENRVLIKEREQDLLKKLEELKHICFGMYAKIIPEGMRFPNHQIPEYYIKEISNDLAKESLKDKTTNDDFYFYSAFYQTSIYYLFVECNEDDHILLSFRKLADTFDSKSIVPIGETIYDLLISKVNPSHPDKIMRSYSQSCIQSYDEFKKYYAECMIPAEFAQRVRIGVNGYADKHRYSSIVSTKKYSEVFEMIENVCDQAYFTVYQRYGDKK